MSGAFTSPRLSVLIPFYRDDPSVLLRSLTDQSVPPGDVEILIMDDGSGDPALTEQVETTIANCGRPIQLISSELNRGRSATRNALQNQARSDWVLFLDADMRLDHSDFLSRYLAEIETDEADIIFGGFTVERKAQDRDTDLHRHLSEVSDCLSAEERRASPAQFVASSNLCVRQSVLKSEPFDPDFSGWGWEDSEWAARVSRRFKLLHIDNPAVHLGLESTDTLLSRFATSAPNYLRFHAAHPELVESLPLYRIVRRLSSLPGQRLMQPFLKHITRMRALPTRWRVVSLKLWRASHYARAIK